MHSNGTSPGNQEGSQRAEDEPAEAGGPRWNRAETVVDPRERRERHPLDDPEDRRASPEHGAVYAGAGRRQDPPDPRSGNAAGGGEDAGEHLPDDPRALHPGPDPEQRGHEGPRG